MTEELIDPIRCHPILKQKIWGGTQLPQLKLAKTDIVSPIGESWEISGLDGQESIVATGRYEGLCLSQLIDRLQVSLMGHANYQKYGNRFPLLIKLIDSSQDLSVQVHPSDSIAQQQD